jgi:hypothetical protein
VHFVDGQIQGDLANLAETRTEILTIDVRMVREREDLFDLLQSAFRFPYFGRNWDALDDVLRDLSWIEARGFVLIVDGAETLWARLPLMAGALVESWLLSADYWAARDIPFHLVFQLGNVDGVS